MSFIYKYIKANLKGVNKIKRFKKLDNKIKVIAIAIILFVCFISSIYFIDLRLTPSIITDSDVEVRAKVTEIINSVILNEYSKNFNYDTMIHVDKDNERNIVMIKADTLRMNKIASDVALESQKNIKKIGKIIKLLCIKITAVLLYKYINFTFLPS